MVKIWTTFGNPLGRLLGRFLVDFGFQNERVWGAKSGTKKGSVAGRLIFKKHWKSIRFFQYFDGLGGSDFQYKIGKKLHNFWIVF